MVPGITSYKSVNHGSVVMVCDTDIYIYIYGYHGSDMLIIVQLLAGTSQPIGDWVKRYAHRDVIKALGHC